MLISGNTYEAECNSNNELADIKPVIYRLLLLLLDSDPGLQRLMEASDSSIVLY